MTRLVFINGAPGSGKSTIALALAQDEPMTLALNIDGLKHSLGRWDEDPATSGLHARRLTLALAGEQLRTGFDLVIGQYLARPPFIEDMEQLAERHGARFYEFVLDLDVNTLAKRPAARASDPDRLDHAVNNRLVGPKDATALISTIDSLRQSRPRAEERSGAKVPDTVQRCLPRATVGLHHQRVDVDPSPAWCRRLEAVRPPVTLDRVPDALQRLSNVAFSVA